MTKIKSTITSGESLRTHFEVLGLEGQVFDLFSKPQVLKNCPVLGLRTALLFELLKFCSSPEKNFLKILMFGDHLKNHFDDLSLENTCACVFGLKKVWPWP